MSEKYFDRYCLEFQNATATTKRISLFNTVSTELAGKAVFINQVIPTLLSPRAEKAFTIVPSQGALQVCLSEAEYNGVAWLISETLGDSKIIAVSEKSVDQSQWESTSAIEDGNVLRRVDFSSRETYSIQNAFAQPWLWIAGWLFLFIFDFLLLFFAFRLPKLKVRTK